MIVNYRTPQLVCSALASLVHELDPPAQIAAVVDNGSGDDSVEIISRWIRDQRMDDRVRLVESPDNRGFGAGNNLAFREVDADFHLLLNSDARLQPGAITALLAEAAEHPRAGLVGVRLESPSGEPQTSCFRFPSPVSELIEAAATGPVSRMLASWEVPLPVSDAPSSPDWTSFACVLARRDAVRSVGLMDEGYFLYYEDVDYCRRMRDAGWDVRCTPRACAVHDHGGSSPVPDRIRRRSRLPGYLYRSRARYFARYYGLPGLWLANLLWTLGRAISLARELVGNKRAHVCERAWLDIWARDRQPGDVQRADRVRS